MTDNNINCSNQLCKAIINYDPENFTNEDFKRFKEEGPPFYEMGTPSGYADEYVFCCKCGPTAKKHFGIVSAHSGGMVLDPDCKGSPIGGDDDFLNNQAHTCKFSKTERDEAIGAFKHYR